MPEKETLKRAREDKRKGRAATTQAGEFVREEMHHIRRGKHGARSPEQAIAIGLSKARRSGVKLPPPPAGTPSAEKKTTRSRRKPSAKRARATSSALKREGKAAASEKSLASHARRAARRRTAADRSKSARKAARTRARKAS